MKNPARKPSHVVVGAVAAAVGVAGWLLVWGIGSSPALARQATPASRPPRTLPADPDAELKRLKEERRRFQDQELNTSRPLSLIFNPGDPPRIIWRDVDEVRRLGSDGNLRVRWFDAELNESDKPAHPGRWGAAIEGTAPNGTPVRRAMTAFCRPPMFLLFLFPPDFTIAFPSGPGGIPPEAWREHRGELDRIPRDILFRAVNDTQAGIAFFASLAASRPHGRPPLSTETMAVLDEDLHLAIKLKVLGLDRKARPLDPPRRRANPAHVLHEGPRAEAGMSEGTPARLEGICKAWAEDSGEPFVTLVARRGVIVTHRAFGLDERKNPIGLDYRCDVASITKTATAMLFSRFLDQGRIGLDDSVATVFPDYPKGSPHVPTFRHCLTHMSGLSGHGDWNGVRNPHLENVVLNGIDANEPGKAYNYTGMGFDLAAKAMEIVAGKSAMHLYRDDLFEPLGMGDVPMELASSGAKFTAQDLGIIAQWLVNRGSYGDAQLIAPETFEKLLPEPLGRRYPGVAEEEGIGMHWMRTLKPGAKPGSTRPEDVVLSPRTVGHGSLSSCLLLADLDQQVVVAQVRKTAGPRFGEWSLKFLQAIAEGIVPPSP